MANLPQLQRLMITDFTSQKSWISPLLIVINTFMQSMVSAMSNKLTVSQNMSGAVLSATVTELPSIKSPYQILWNLPSSPTLVMKANVTSLLNTIQTVAVDFQWNYDSTNKIVNITNIIGISPSISNPYTLTLVALTG